MNPILLLLPLPRHLRLQHKFLPRQRLPLQELQLQFPQRPQHLHLLPSLQVSLPQLLTLLQLYHQKQTLFWEQKQLLRPFRLRLWLKFKNPPQSSPLSLWAEGWCCFLPVVYLRFVCIRIINFKHERANGSNAQ